MLKPFLCITCGYYADSIDRLRRHVRRHKKKYAVKVVRKKYNHKCKYCHGYFTKLGDMNEHIKLVHKPFTCKYCDRFLARNDVLKRHIRRLHEPFDKPYLCKHCQARFTTAKDRNIHVKVHANTRPYPCEHCPKRFVQRCHVLRHIRWQHNKERPHSCEYCEKRFPNRSTLKNHVRRIHTKEKPHSCGLCERRFVDSSELSTHIRKVHNKEKPYQCQHCQKWFSDKRDLKSHIGTHARKQMKKYQNRFLTTCSAHLYAQAGLADGVSPVIFTQQDDVRTLEETHTGEESSLSCMHCSMQFANQDGLSAHIKTHMVPNDTVGTSVSCMYCSVQFSNQEDLSAHIETHITKESQYPCMYCSVSFTKLGDLLPRIKIHMETSTKESSFPSHEGTCNNLPDNTVLQCQTCRMQFATFDDFVSHKLTHAKKKKSSVTRAASHRLSKCEYCQKEYRIDYLKLHIKKMHLTEKVPLYCQRCDKSFSCDSEMRSHFMTLHKREKNLECGLCPQRLTCTKTLKRHWKKHVRDNQYQYRPQCEYCLEEFTSESEIKEHIGQAHNLDQNKDRPYQCRYCQKHFKKSVYLKQHIKLHTEKKEYLCEFCPKLFQDIRNLNMHRKAQHVENKETYQCTMCEKVLKTKATLSDHMKALHSTELPYKCEFCAKSFGLKSSLTVHYQVHNDKNLKCKFCSKAFAYQNLLRKHEARHSGHKPHECDYCGKCFGKRYMLGIHVRTHTGEKPYKCDICERAFAARSNMTAHRKTHSKQKGTKSG